MDANDNDVVSVSEFVENRLYFMTFNNMLDLTQGEPLVHYFCTDDIFKYENFYDDFGPLNLSMLYRYCHTLNLKMRHIRTTKIVHAASSAPRKRANAAYLIGCYAIIYLDFTPQQAFAILTAQSSEDFVDFRDASSAEPHTISLLDCFSGLHKAKTMGFFNFDNFDFEHYEFYERIENGDLNWIVPRKFLAFCGPYNVCENFGTYPVHAVAFYYRYFRLNGVTTVVRLNKRAYSASLFTRAGFAHRDLYFMDGSTPTDEILNEFLQICEGTNGAVAVHCKAGLGRTGTLIACYIMKHYRFTAHEAIAWIRICRPGSIIGPQQEWILSKMTEMWNAGQAFRRRRWRSPAVLPTPPTHRTPIYAVRAGQPFAGLSSKFHRQHVRLHCRSVVPPPFFDSLSTGVKGRYTTLPNTKGCTVTDSIKARNRVKQRQQIRAQQQAATRAIGGRIMEKQRRVFSNIYSEYVIDSDDSTSDSNSDRNYNSCYDGGFATTSAADEAVAIARCSNYSEERCTRCEMEGDNDEDSSDSHKTINEDTTAIQRKVNTMKLDDQNVLDSDDDCEHNTDSEESDDEDDEVVNNNNRKKDSVEESDDTDIDEEVVEINANIPIADKLASNNNNNNSIAKALKQKDADVGNLTQGDKLNMVKAQRTRYALNTIESTSNIVRAAKLVAKVFDIKSSPIIQPHAMTLRTQSRMSNKSAETPNKVTTPIRTNIKSTNTKRRGNDANASPRALNSNDKHVACNSVRRISARIAAKTAASGTVKTPSSSTASSASEDTATSRKTVIPNPKIWISRVVPNNETNNVSSTPLSGMETRSKRALISERRTVKVFRKTNQVGAPTKTRKVDAAATSKN